MALADEFSTDAIIKKLRLYDFSSASQTQYGDSDILLIFDDMIREIILPNLIRLNEGYCLVKTDYPFVANQVEYPLPERCLLNIVSMITVLDSTLNEVGLSRVNVNSFDFRNTSRTGRPYSYTLYDSSIIFNSKPLVGTSDLYRVFYYRRPNKLVMLAESAMVQNVDKITGVVTYVSIPSTFTSSSSHDFIYRVSPFTILKENVKASALAGLTQTFPVAAVQNLNPGDYVCLTGQTIVPALPVELTQLLIETFMLMSAQAQNDGSKFQLADKLVSDRIGNIYALPGLRVVNQPESIDIFQGPIGWYSV